MSAVYFKEQIVVDFNELRNFGLHVQGINTCLYFKELTTVAQGTICGIHTARN